MPARSTQRLDADASLLWNALAFEIIRRVALTETAFTTDAIWLILDNLPKPDDPRALGPILLRARDEGLIKKTDLVVSSSRRACHGRPTAVWLSVPNNATLNDAAAYVTKQKNKVTVPAFPFMNDIAAT